MCRTSTGFALVVAVLLVGLAGPASSAPSGLGAIAANSVTFTDAAGDNFGGSPDLTTVRASNDDNGVVRFDVVLPNRTDLGDLDFVVGYLDTDRNAATGCTLPSTTGQPLIGIERSFIYRGKTEPELDSDPLVFQWVGCDAQDPGPLRMEPVGGFTPATSTLTIRFHSADIGDPAGFRFVVIAQTDPIPEGRLDFAPNQGTWSYDIRVTPQKPRPPRDRTAPRVRTLASTGTAGAVARLRYSVFDDSQKTRETIRVSRGGRVLGVTKTTLGPRSVTKIYARPWRIPDGVSGRLRFCVTAWDAAGNRSAPSCSPLVIR
jgi:hypothetical protein